MITNLRIAGVTAASAFSAIFIGGCKNGPRMKDGPKMEDRLATLGLALPDILLPKKFADRGEMHKWATIACDQYTSNQQYWSGVEDIVGESPSTLRLMMPEIYLDPEYYTADQKEARKANIQQCMSTYEAEHLADPRHSPLLLERTSVEGRQRHGLLLAIDLEAYDYSIGSTSTVRATERTIESRLPDRVAIRSEANLEMPHIIMLVDDPSHSIIEPLVNEAHRGKMETVYDFDLMQQGGHLKSWEVRPHTELLFFNFYLSNF